VRIAAPGERKLLSRALAFAGMAGAVGSVMPLPEPSSAARLALEGRVALVRQRLAGAETQFTAVPGAFTVAQANNWNNWPNFNNWANWANG